MTDWEEIYTQLKEEKTIYGIAETMNKEQADNYFNWLGNKYPKIKPFIEQSRKNKKRILNEVFDRDNLNGIISELSSIVNSKKSEFQIEAAKQLRGLFKSKSADNPLTADFKKIDSKEIEESENVINEVQFDSESIVFFTNALIEELYLKALPKYFDEKLRGAKKNFSDLSGVKWEGARKKLFNTLRSNFTGCEEEKLKPLHVKLSNCVRELEEIINSAKSKPIVVEQPIPTAPPIVTPPVGGDDDVDKEIKKIQDEIDKFRGQDHNDRNNNDRLTLINNLKQKKDWMFTGSEPQKKAVSTKRNELEKAIEDLELEILQHKAIQKIKDELDDKRNGNKMKLTEDDLIEPDYTNFASKIFQLKSKEEVDDFKNRVIEEIIFLKEPYSLLDKIIAKGEKALKDEDHRVIKDVLGTLETYYSVASDSGEKAYEQKSKIINNLKTRLLRVSLEAQQLHVNR